MACAQGLCHESSLPTAASWMKGNEVNSCKPARRKACRVMERDGRRRQRVKKKGTKDSIYHYNALTCNLIFILPAISTTYVYNIEMDNIIRS